MLERVKFDLVDGVLYYEVPAFPGRYCCVNLFWKKLVLHVMVDTLRRERCMIDCEGSGGRDEG